MLQSKSFKLATHNPLCLAFVAEGGTILRKHKPVISSQALGNICLPSGSYMYVQERAWGMRPEYSVYP